MDNNLSTRLKHAWNAFLSRDPTPATKYGSGIFYRQERPRFGRGNEKTIVTAVYNRIAIDAAAIDIKHVREDEDGQMIETIKSGLNNCLSIEANIDQTGRAFVQDAVMSMIDEGCIAIVPTETSIKPNPDNPGSFNINSVRVGKIVEWFPRHVKVRLYNDQTGKQEEIILSKMVVALPENPLYAVMNEPNSTMQRLIRKLSLLDVIDEQSGSGKLDLIVQLPFAIKSQAKRQQADTRRKDIEDQLSGSRYGIAYIDSTEHVTQLNRSVENNLMTQIEYLTKLLFSQLGITQAIMDGSASEQELLNYYNRTIEPILSAIVDEMKRKFLTKTARTQGQSITFFRDPFRLIPVASLAEIADKFTRNAILSSNEVRQIIGMKPVDDPMADELSNKNMPQEEYPAPMEEQELMEEQVENPLSVPVSTLTEQDDDKYDSDPLSTPLSFLE